jgi:uncharacterized membrane protein
MTKSRLEAFSDGVIAIIITIMVLELKVPQGADLAALSPLLPKLLSYILSFVFLGIYWNNHHHLFQLVHHVNGRILWANLHLLFWLSLTPFVTDWMGENNFAPLPMALYAIVLWFDGFAFYILASSLIAIHGRESPLALALGDDLKGKVSLVLYTFAIPLSFVNTEIAFGLLVVVAIIWFIPDRRIERTIDQEPVS